MNPWGARLAGLVFVSIFTAACGGNVVFQEDGDGQGGDASTSGQPRGSSSSSPSMSSSPNTTTGPLTLQGVVFRGAAGRVILRISTDQLDCADPDEPIPDYCGSLDIQLDIPDAYLTPGNTLGPDTKNALSQYSEKTFPDSTGECDGVFGTSTPFANVTIESVDSAAATVTLSGWNEVLWSHSVDGTYALTNCLGTFD